ncbi:MAG: hypothetical protein L0Z62_06760 [Gemmataceae bacterium]|nr:hypothetical protein [Gemmataceae bacterium]
MRQTSSNSYPRATPYRSPQPTSKAPEPRGTFLHTLAAALGLVVVTAAGTLLVVRSTEPPVPLAPPNDPPAVAKERPNERPPPPLPSASKPAPAPAKAKRPEQERFLQALGGLSAAHVYQSYLNIGLLADGVESEAHTKAEAEQMLATVAAMIDLVDRQLDKVGELGLEADDQQSVERIQELTVLLRRQASALRSYWASGDEEHITRYHEARETTWNTLSKLLGID